MADSLDPRILKALEKAKEKWAKLQAAPAYREMVAGDYLCRFDAAKSKLWIAETGQTGFKVCFVVIEGEFLDRRLFVDYWINAADEMADRISIRDVVNVLGLTLDDLKSPPNVEGKFLVTVRGEEGKTKVLKFEAV